MLFIICFILAFILASFAEYWIHRLMHMYPKFGRDITPHYQHHQENYGQGVILEFREYSKVVVLSLLAFLISVPVGISVLLGSFAFAAFSAYAHQLQHDNPTLCFWLEMPVHYVHHKYEQWDCNFGLAFDWWDKVFGTYKSVDWLTEEELNRPEQSHWQVRWW
jgi:sterol desaturase/sphingolipid hydroxylase (fatty acid hydroxylase superfamily)